MPKPPLRPWHGRRSSGRGLLRPRVLSPLFDREFLALLDAHPEGGPAAPPHPFLSLRQLPRDVQSAWARGDHSPLVAHLSSSASLDRPLGPLFDPRRLAPAHRAQHDRPGGSFLAFLRDAEPSSPMPVAPGHRGPIPTVEEARDALLRTARASRPGTTSAEPRAVVGDPRRPGAVAVSVVMLLDPRSRRPAHAVRRALDALDVHGEVDAVVVDVGLPVDKALDVTASFLADPRVTVLRAATGTTRGRAHNLGAAACSGEVLAFLDAGIVPEPGWLGELQRGLESPGVLGVQPAVLDDASGIAAAGLVLDDPSGPRAHLCGHPLGDVALVAGESFAALGGGALAVRRSDFTATGGFDPAREGLLLEADLCRRLRAARPGVFTVEPGSRVVRSETGSTPTERTDAAVDRNARRQAERPGQAHAHRRRTPAGADSALRWGIRIASTPGSYGDVWGDTFFADSLASAIAGRGDHAVVYRRGRHDAPGSELDDVLLGIRGLEPIRPRAGCVNVLWIISHPDAVTGAELEGFDLVYSASATWAARATQRFGREVRTLLQATDVHGSTAHETPLGSGVPAVFVGSGRNRTRPAVQAALETGTPVVVYGPGWRETLPRRLHGGDHLANEDLAATYRRHGLVLADHWHDMAEAGFVPNRLFDAVAAGVPVVSSPLPGVEELFRGAVQVFRTPEELHSLVVGDARRRFPDPGTMIEIARSVAHEHSFEARARTLLLDVGAVRVSAVPRDRAPLNCPRNDTDVEGRACR